MSLYATNEAFGGGGGGGGPGQVIVIGTPSNGLTLVGDTLTLSPSTFFVGDLAAIPGQDGVVAAVSPSTADTNGTNLVLAAGYGTGLAHSGKLIFRGNDGQDGASGTAVQGIYDAMDIDFIARHINMYIAPFITNNSDCIFDVGSRITMMGTSNSGNIGYNPTTNKFDLFQAGLQSQFTSSMWSTVSDAPIVDTTTESSIMPSGFGAKTFSGPSMQSGGSYYVRLGGNFNTGLTPGNIVIKGYIQSQNNGATASIALPLSVTSGEWLLEYTVTFNSVGVGADCTVAGSLSIEQASGEFKVYPFKNVSNSFNSTLDAGIDTTITYNTADASNVWGVQQGNLLLFR